MRKSVVVCLSFLLLFNACHNKVEGDVLTFESSCELKADVLSSDALEMVYPFDMFVTDSFIFVLGNANKKWLHCYNRLSGVYVDSYVNVGRGPGELLTCTKTHFSEDSEQVFLFDSSSEKLVKYQLQEHGKNAHLVDEISFAGLDSVVFKKMWPLSEKLVLTSAQMGSMKDTMMRYQIYSESGECVQSCNGIPDLNNEDKYTYLQSFETLSPDKRHFASVTLMGEILEIYTISNTSIAKSVEKVYSYPNVKFHDGVLWETDETIWGFPYVNSNNNYIFASMIHGNNPKEYNKIAVFDWSGNGKLMITTDFNVLRLTPYKNMLYAIVANQSNELYLASYDFKQIVYVQKGL